MNMSWLHAENIELRNIAQVFVNTVVVSSLKERNEYVSLIEYAIRTVVKMIKSTDRRVYLNNI